MEKRKCPKQGITSAKVIIIIGQEVSNNFQCSSSPI